MLIIVNGYKVVSNKPENPSSYLSLQPLNSSSVKSGGNPQSNIHKWIKKKFRSVYFRSKVTIERRDETFTRYRDHLYAEDVTKVHFDGTPHDTVHLRGASRKKPPYYVPFISFHNPLSRYIFT